MRDSMLKKIILPGVIFLVVVFFWLSVTPSGPSMYAEGEPEAFANMTWYNIWSWTDLGSYDRYSLTAYYPIALIDGHLLAPLYGIEFPSEEFQITSRFKLYYVFMIGIASCLTYFLAKRLSLDGLPALITALYMGLHKGWYWGFGTMSIIAVIPLLLIYGMMILFFWVTYLRTRKISHLIGYIISFLLIAGAWEQWINYLFFFVFFNLLLLLLPKARSVLMSDSNLDEDKRDGCRAIFLSGVVFPLVLFSVYMGFRLSVVGTQMSASTGEDAMTFSYPHSLGNSPGVWMLMVEDASANITLHLASTIESLFFPWKMLSQAVIFQYDVDLFNPAYASYSNVQHYLALTDWYSGLLSGFFFCTTIWILWYLRENKNGRDLLISGAGLILIYTGFLVHIPIMYRAYFAAPDFAGLLDYKHMFSVLGFSLLLGWGWEKITAKIANTRVKFIMTVIIGIWLIFTNVNKIH